ncbi:hypothetical protein PF029_12755 [Enterococcus thailandicus]|uniref:hypothetical protein n=1 Tax=Enterococcus thailandicus TaxID=417368 RepID=UPI0022EBF453|nr:hypothetical protein [Enterococcus thailandicus]MDA3982338.1 hypothetical protein [Enterococcus thailandicus]
MKITFRMLLIIEPHRIAPNRIESNRTESFAINMYLFLNRIVPMYLDAYRIVFHMRDSHP